MAYTYGMKGIPLTFTQLSKSPDNIKSFPAGGHGLGGLTKRAKTAPPSQVEFTVPGTYSWICPAGVTSISVVCVGGGGGGGGWAKAGGGGGGLRYAISLAVTPGEMLTIVVGAAGVGNTKGNGSPGGESSISRGVTKLIYASGGGGGTTAAALGGTGSTLGGDIYGGDGGIGQIGQNSYGGGGGGAGGYSGTGGNGGVGSGGHGAAGSGGGGGGGGGGIDQISLGSTEYGGGAGGGGVGIYGEGESGAGGLGNIIPSNGGLGGSSGTRGANSPLSGRGGIGGNFGGGGGGGDSASYGESGGPGVVRVIWGNGRFYPSTRTADE